MSELRELDREADRRDELEHAQRAVETLKSSASALTTRRPAISVPSSVLETTADDEDVCGRTGTRIDGAFAAPRCDGNVRPGRPERPGASRRRRSAERGEDGSASPAVSALLM